MNASLEKSMGHGTGDQDRRTRGNGLLASMSNFKFIIALVTLMKCLSLYKPLSIQLQKRNSDVFKA